MSFRKVTTATINGDLWEIGFGYCGKTKGQKDDGVCNYEKKRIIIASAHNGRVCTLEDAVIHEVAHAVLPQIDEYTINKLGQVASDVLFAMKSSEQHSS
jgi:hypothetical protein